MTDLEADLKIANARIKQLEAERDAAIEIMKNNLPYGGCSECRHIWRNNGSGTTKNDKECETCSRNDLWWDTGRRTKDNWEWRGMKGEANG